MESIIKTDLYRYGGLKGYKGFIKGLMIPGLDTLFYYERLLYIKNGLS